MLIKHRQFLITVSVCLLLLASGLAFNTSAAEGDSAQSIIEKYEKERQALEAQWAEEKRLKKLDQKQVVKELGEYTFPLQQSRCAGFVVDWNQIQTVQDYIQTSVAFSKELGNCLHAEKKSNVESLASDLKKANSGETEWSWNGEGMPASIQSIGPFANFSANFDRCNSECFRLFQELLGKAANISKSKRDEFLAQWDSYTENNIKPALKQQNPEGYAQSNMDEKFAEIRFALKHFSFQRNDSKS